MQCRINLIFVKVNEIAPVAKNISSLYHVMEIDDHNDQVKQTFVEDTPSLSLGFQ